jgi:hypothetical protein
MFLLLGILLPMVFLDGCAVGARLDTRIAQPADISGTYTVYLHGCRYPSDIETMALLVDTAGPYPVDLIAPPASYRKTEPLAGPEALATAAKFVQCGIYATGVHVLRGIADPAGKVIAFEVKPLYPPLEMGAEEVLYSDYFLRDGRVRAFFQLAPQVERVRRHDIPSSGDP